MTIELSEQEYARLLAGLSSSIFHSEAFIQDMREGDTLDYWKDTINQDKNLIQKLKYHKKQETP